MSGKSTYIPENCEIVLEEMMNGADFDELPYHLGVCMETIRNWMRKHPEFAKAVNDGKSFSRANWYHKGRINLENKNFNYVGWYMNMKNRHGWSDRQLTYTEINIGDEARNMINGSNSRIDHVIEEKDKPYLESSMEDDDA